MALPYIKFYPGDFKRDTADLTFDQRAAYWELLQHQWAKGSVPDDDAKLSRIIGIEQRRWMRMRNEVLAFFDRVDGRWVQKRMASDREVAAALNAIRRESASLGGKAKALKEKEIALAPAKHMACQTDVGDIAPQESQDSQVRQDSLNGCLLDKEFAEIWSHFPRKERRIEGRREYGEARQIATFGDIVAGVNRLRAQDRDPQFYPTLPKWLRECRWTDEPAPEVKKRDPLLEACARRIEEADARAAQSASDEATNIVVLSTAKAR